MLEGPRDDKDSVVKQMMVKLWIRHEYDKTVVGTRECRLSDVSGICGRRLLTAKFVNCADLDLVGDFTGSSQEKPGQCEGLFELFCHVSLILYLRLSSHLESGR